MFINLVDLYYENHKVNVTNT